jgi:hypothetical protein
VKVGKRCSVKVAPIRFESAVGTAATAGLGAEIGCEERQLYYRSSFP